MKEYLIAVITVVSIIFILIFFTFVVKVKPDNIIQQKSEQTAELKTENLQELKIVSAGKTVSEGVASEKYAVKTKDGNIVEIGTERHSPPAPPKQSLINALIKNVQASDGKVLAQNQTSEGGPKPYINLDKWDGEVSLKISMPFATGDNPTIIGNKLRYSTADQPLAQSTLWQKLLSSLTAKAQAGNPRIDIDIYPKQPETKTETVNGETQTFVQNEDGGIEFDTILYEKPLSNKIVFPIEAKNLDFSYQPALNQEVKIGEEGVVSCTETDCYNTAGTVITHRPENIVGGYAVYYKDGKFGDYSQMGGKNYRAGKAFHIYRPKIRDASGKEIWGTLSIDDGSAGQGSPNGGSPQGTGTLTITVPQNFLDNAQYPVTIDPNFGYETLGGSTTSIVDAIVGTAYTVGGDGNSTMGVVSMTAGFGSIPAGEEAKLAIYNGTAFVAQTNTRTNCTGSAWCIFTFATQPVVVSGTSYGLVAWGTGSASYYFRFDSVSMTRYTRSLTYTTSYPDPFGGTIITANAKASIYATHWTVMNFENVDLEGINIPAY